MMNLVLYFGIYSFLGWICETIYCSVPAKRFVNRGFLAGPVCPVYGVGALVVIGLLSRLTPYPILLYIVGVVLTTAVEYVTAYLLEYLFHAKWWDYSKHRYNYKGRICLLNSILFGVLVLVLMLGVHPRVVLILASIPVALQVTLVVFILATLMVDATWSVVAVAQLNTKIKTLSLKDLNLKARIVETLSFSQKRILLAFPSLRHKKYDSQLRHLKEKWLQKLSKK
jgi:uncharacterized membrane protein